MIMRWISRALVAAVGSFVWRKVKESRRPG
jgi:hypothetical protein